MAGVTRDPWATFAGLTPARIGLGRAGASLPTREVLALALAHGQARDAVYAKLDLIALRAGLAALGQTVVAVTSPATDRARYLTRPDLGRRVDAASRATLVAVAGRFDLAIVIGDGLSARAVDAHALVLIEALLPIVASLGMSLAPLVVAEGARVALGDDIATTLGARAVVVLIGERPGLSSPDSLGAYLTFDARPGRTDAERNCISNIRPAGLAPVLAAAKLAWLVREAFMRGCTGIALKDESDAGLVAGNERGALGPPAAR